MLCLNTFVILEVSHCCITSTTGSVTLFYILGGVQKHSCLCLSDISLFVSSYSFMSPTKSNLRCWFICIICFNIFLDPLAIYFFLCFNFMTRF